MAHTHTHEHKIWTMSEEQKKAIAKSTRDLRTADEEFEAAFKILKKYPKRVTFFGSARLSPRTDYYHMARDIAARLADDGFAIISGGGNGIMEASNRGAFDEQDVSVGFNIRLPHEQHLNPYTTDHLTFNFFFTRKVMMTFYAHGFVCFPGGFGTLDEMFEIITLIQTGKMPKVPVILVGKKYWKDLDRFVHKHLLRKGLISAGDEKIYTITDDYDAICKIINKEFNK
ncbi:TIGR00730 family Rossman fold protein [Candidatus Saccharibacteria bacterium]|nr:MAG: TIGR00730 family Rossman fold protein [Candidatus Saccharibacteria bacterium]